jgi:8-oxo-dGTP diphosphatase
MTGQAFTPSPVPAVIAVVVHEGRTLLVRRANPPDAGLWGFPGGRIEHGETVHAAAMRELAEETSVRAEAQDVITTLDILDRSDEGTLRHHFVLIAVRCRWLSGVPTAGDDALEARWFRIEDLHPGRIDMSADVGVIARRADSLARGAARPEADHGDFCR